MSMPIECRPGSPFYNPAACKGGGKPVKVDPDLQAFGLEPTLAVGATAGHDIEGASLASNLRLEFHWRPKRDQGRASLRTGFQVRRIPGELREPTYLVGGLLGIRGIVHNKIDSTVDFFAEGNGEGRGWGFLFGMNLLINPKVKIGPLVGMTYNSGIPEADRALFVGAGLTVTDVFQFGPRLR